MINRKMKMNILESFVPTNRIFINAIEIFRNSDSNEDRRTLKKPVF